MNKEPRYKLLPVDPRILVDAMGQMIGDTHEYTKHLSWETMKEIEGATVDAVNYDFQYDCLMFRLWRQDWPKVPLGHMIPQLSSPSSVFMMRNQ